MIRARSKRKPDIWFRYLLGTVWFIAGSPDMFSVGIKDSKETVCFLVQDCFPVRSRRSYYKLINVELEQLVLITVRVVWKTPPELSTDVPRMFMTVQLGEEKQVWLAGSQRMLARLSFAKLHLIKPQELWYNVQTRPESGTSTNTSDLSARWWSDDSVGTWQPLSRPWTPLSHGSSLGWQPRLSDVITWCVTAL